MTTEEKDFLMNCTFTPSINNNTVWKPVAISDDMINKNKNNFS